MSPSVTKKVQKVKKPSSKSNTNELVRKIKEKAEVQKIPEPEKTETVGADETLEPKEEDKIDDTVEEPEQKYESFNDFGLVPEILEACEKLKYTKPTPIQAESIPYALKGRDIIGLAQTGSGKTAAFAIPVLQSLYEQATPFFCCVLAPTRELAYQIKETFDSLGSGMGLRSVCIVGGMDMIDQAKDLMRKPHVIVATPGRLMDHLENTKGFSLKALKYLIMDEADRLLDLEFGPAIDKVLKLIPRERSTYLFSATMTNKIEKLQRASLVDPIKVSVSSKYSTVDSLIQSLMVVPDGYKNTFLIYLLNKYQNKSIIIFTRTCAHAQRTALLARLMDFSAIPLHGQLNQSQRLGALNKFKSRERTILVATDVAARGLDIPMVDVVINFDIPTDSKAYIHRVGRTARAGRSGRSISLVTQYDLELILRVESVLGMKLPKDVPPRDEILSLHNTVEKFHNEAVRQIKEHQNRPSGKRSKKRD
ncbi:ribosomal RNA processing protein [Komagataella kurtzmanii]|nr:ribosomal RNA processing protein [Komagataella kurtzmanii]